MLYEFKAGLEAYFASLGPKAPVKTLADAIAFNERNREREMPFFGQELLEKALAKGPLTDAAYRKALARCRRLSRKEGLDAVFARHRLDAILAPTGAPAWTTDLVNGDHFVLSSSTPAAVAGYPAVTVPAGQVFGLPVGITFMGPPWSEGPLLGLAFAYEQSTRLRRPPRFLPTADLAAP
jgi:amidase